MFRRKKIKFYLHQESYVKISSFKRKSFLLKKFLMLILGVLFEVSYKLGKWLHKFFYTMYFGFKSEYKKTAYSLKTKYNHFLKNNPVFNVLFLTSGLAILIFVITVFSSAGNAGVALEKIFHLGVLGKQSLVNSVSRADVSQTESSLVKASYFFTDAQKELSSLDTQTQILLQIVPVKKETTKILDLGQIFAETGQEFVILGEEIKLIKVSASGLSAVEGKSLNERLNTIEKSLQKIETSLNTAGVIINSLNLYIYPKKVESAVVELKQKFSELQTNFSSARNVFYALRNLFENNENILVVFQNNNELRPTGGFIGTLAELKMKDGLIQKLDVNSVYEKDGQLQEKIFPPHPIINVNSRWFLRDANWFSDFSQSAEKIIDFYEKEGGETPKAVIAITPKIIIDLLEYTGPVYLEKYNLTLTSENFVEMVQIGTSASKDDPENKPKQLLADLIPVLLSKLSGESSTTKTKLLLVFQKNLAEKNIQFYSKDKFLQQQFKDLGWDGQIIDTKSDYLNIVSANLEGTKTDLFIKQEVELYTEIAKNGKIINTLKITRENRLPKLSKTFNNSFLRILVPKGSRLLSNEGFDFKTLDTQNLQTENVDQEVANWEQGIIRDLKTGTVIGTESGKTFFGNWLKLEGGEKKSVTLTYELPFLAERLKQYSLTIQKQPGSLEQKYQYQLKTDGLLPVFTTKPIPSAKNKEMRYNFDLDKDKFFGFIFNKS